MTQTILIMGAGSVGCYLGGLLAASGATVHFVGRPRVLQALGQSGLTVSDMDGRSSTLPAAALQLHEAVPAGLAPELTLLCVKSGATVDAARELSTALPAGSLVLSMQNGLGNAQRGQAAAPQLDWRPGMVPFNIAELGPGRFHRGTAGALAAQGRTDEPALQALAAAFASQGLKLRLHADLQAIQWGKLVINLNNPVNALSGRPLRAELLEHGYRSCWAALQEEALDLLEAAGIEVAQMTALTPRKLLRVLRLPSPLFRLVAAKMLKVDEKARSSMADDLALGRVTEIDALSGEVVRLAARLGRRAPLNERIQQLVEAWPQQREFFAPKQLLAALRQG
ncbi:2-dehydropantoate 2-reductase [Pelomonas sp. KK5]|uniref:2-dehydropantoate 2-reductase n=1 Tax=Pelomonas sp. KK5 TaxID=1855730 RepID=UPI00097C2C08|nr:2-dehydropantoate 2-reductase [Pelomonas sp. KK5]